MFSFYSLLHCSSEPSLAGYVQQIEGEGIAAFEQDGKFGDLFVEYNVVLPSSISQLARTSELFSAFTGAITT